MNITASVRINSGAALLLYLVNFQIMLLEAAKWPAVERLFPVAIGALTGAFAGFLVKRNSNNKLDLEAKLKTCPPGEDAK